MAANKLLLAFVTGAAIGAGSLYLFNESQLQLNFSRLQLEKKLAQLFAKEPARLAPVDPKVKVPSQPKRELAVGAEPGLPEQFSSLLNANHYEQAFELLESQLKLGRERPYAQTLYLYIYDLIEPQPELAKHLTEQSLELDYSNLFFHYLALLANMELMNYPQALDHLIYMRDAYIPERLAESVALQQKKLIEAYSNELELMADGAAMARFISQLEYLNEQLAANRLADKLNALERQQELAKLYPVQIPLESRGNHHLVEVELNGSITVSLLLDTGASYVAISQKILEQLSYEVIRPDVLFNAANGQHSADVVALESIRVGEIELTQFEVSSLDNYQASDHAGLLGQSFLSLFDWKIDQENHLLYLASK